MDKLKTHTQIRQIKTKNAWKRNEKVDGRAENKKSISLQHKTFFRTHWQTYLFKSF